MVGRDDPSTPPEHAQPIAAAIDGAQLLEVPHARHLPTSSSPEEFTAAVLAHLAGWMTDERYERGHAQAP